MHHNNIQKELEGLLFCDHEIAIILSDYFEEYNLIEKDKVKFIYKIVMKVKYFIKYYFFILKNLLFSKKKTIVNFHGSLIVTNNRRHYKEIIFPLLGKIDMNFMILSSFKDCDNNHKMIDVSQTGHFDFFIWYKEYIKYKINFSNYLSIYFNKNGLFYNKYFYQYILAYQSSQLIRACSFFDNNLISFVLTDFDRGHISSPFILAANQKNINSFTFIHGVPTIENGYYPFIARNIFVWGDYQKNMFEKIINKSQKLLNVGKHWQHNFKKHGDGNVIIALKGDDKIDFDLFLQWNDFATILKQNGKNLFFRPHPNCNVIEIEKIATRFPNIKIDFFNIEGSKLSYDIVICNETSFAFDALYNDCFVVLLTNKIKKESLNEMLINNKCVFVAKNILEIEELFLSQDFEIIFEKTKADKESFKSLYWSAIGEKSIFNIIIKLNEDISRTLCL